MIRFLPLLLSQFDQTFLKCHPLFSLLLELRLALNSTSLWCATLADMSRAGLPNRCNSILFNFLDDSIYGFFGGATADFAFDAAKLALRFGPPAGTGCGGILFLIFIDYASFVFTRHILLQLFVELRYLG